MNRSVIQYMEEGRKLVTSKYKNVLSRKKLLPPATEKSLNLIEKKLGITLPSELKDFLKWADGGILSGGKFIIYSAGKGVHPEETLLAANKRRNTSEPLLFFARESEEEFVFKHRDLNKKNCPVYVYENKKLSKISKSFESFILWTLKR
jgi:hypothetical protein